MNSHVDARLVVLLLPLAALVHLGPEALGLMGVPNWRAWQYVGYGAEASFLWALIGRWVRAGSSHPYVSAAGTATCVGGCMESLLRPMCRLALPMDRYPADAGVSLCRQAGFETAHLTPVWAMVAALCLAIYADYRQPVRLYR